MNKSIILDEECNKIFDFWKLEEYFAPADYPDLTLTVKEYGTDVPFDAYCNDYSTRELPLPEYRSHNLYLAAKKVEEEKLYHRANVYYGCYKTRSFVTKMAEKCSLDLDKYVDITELTGRFYLFSVQIDLRGNITEDGVRISPFFYAVLRMMQTGGRYADIRQEDIATLNADVNEILRQNDEQILEFHDVNKVKRIVFDKLRILSERQVGLEGAAKEIFACKALKGEEEASDFSSFYLDDIEMVQKNYPLHEHVTKYAAALLSDQQNKIMIDNDIDAMGKWLETDRFPLAKYPSRFSPTLMQQVAINIAIAGEDRNEKIFSVNGPPGTGKTTLLKEILASNVERLAEVLITYGINGKNFTARKIESSSNPGYTDKYYEIPDDIARYGMLVVSNNNGAVENVTLDLPKASSVEKDKTRTSSFDRRDHGEVYFSAAADKLLGVQDGAWGLIAARMGRKSYVSDVLGCCVFAKSNADPDKVTLDLAREGSPSWEQAVTNFRTIKNKVLAFREEIKQDKNILSDLDKCRAVYARDKAALDKLLSDKEEGTARQEAIQRELEENEAQTLNLEEEIQYIKKHASMLTRVLIILHLGKTGEHVAQKWKEIEELILEHEEIIRRKLPIDNEVALLCKKCQEQEEIVLLSEEEVNKLQEKVYGRENSLRTKYKGNLADSAFYNNIKGAEDSQNACPWTFDAYDYAREELFYAALQVRKAFILESPYVRRNLFVYEAYNNGRYTGAERAEMFSHLFNTLSIVIPVISSTFASVGRFLKHAGNQSLGMLVIDESGQASPQSAVGAIYRTKSAVVVGDPLQVEPVVTIPQALVDILADSTGVARAYRTLENSVQTFADCMNEFNGTIGERQVGCPLVVHRRCIEPMFSISNLISYDNRMFNKTNNKEDFLRPDQPFLLKKSGWIDIQGPENGGRDHFVKDQAREVCRLLTEALAVYENLFETDDKIFIISPFRTVAEALRGFIAAFFAAHGYEKEQMRKWTGNCVGTVHTFQGKDANEVLLVLGCSDKSPGAMNWVVKKANILNVACTRAKYRIAFIGNVEDWKNRNYFRDFIPYLIDKMEV